MPLWKLTSRDCDQLYARMKAAGLGQSRVRCAHVVLHRAVAQAVRWGWFVRNPVSNATRPPVARVTISPPGIDDVRAALAASRKADIELWCWLQVAIAAGPVEGRCVRSDGVTSTSTSASYASSGRSRQPRAPAWSSSPPRPASLESCRSRHRLSRHLSSEKRKRHEPPQRPEGSRRIRPRVRDRPIRRTTLATRHGHRALDPAPQGDRSQPRQAPRPTPLRRHRAS